MESGTVTSVKKKISLEFRYLPAFAGYIMHNEFDNFVKEHILLYEKTEIALLQYFKSLSVDQRMAFLQESIREMLTLVAGNLTGEYIDQANNSWVRNQLPIIKREQVNWEDITLVNYVRAKAFRKFIPRYTGDNTLHSYLVEEIERFTVILNSEMFSSYMEVQKEEIHHINNALKKREQQLLEAQEIGRVGSFEWDLISNQSSCTPQVFKIFEMESSSNFSSFITDVHPDEQERVRRGLEEALTSGDFECEFRYVKNNREKMILSHGKVQFHDGKAARMIGTVMDVTERHNIIKRLQESEKLHKQAQALTHIGNWSWFIGENKVFWSDEMYRIYGLEPQSEEITYESFTAFIHPDDREVRVAEVRKSLETLQVPEYHFRITTREGHIKVLRGKGEALVGAHQKLIAMLGTCQDITHEYTLTKELKERERYLEELNQSLRAANQELSRTNEELESFNFIASHDLQEPLRKIQIYSNRILESGLKDLPGPLQDYFARINNASRRMQRLIEDFLSFSQSFNISESMEDVDLAEIIDDITVELGNRIEEKKARIEVGGLPALYGISFQIKQLMSNLITNAIKYTAEGAAPHIVISGEIVRGSELQGGLDPKKSYTKISVADNGIGFEEKYTSRIFGLFQRLHSRDVYSGTGIGLALCKKIIQNMNGYITAKSAPGKGSVFTFYIPVKKDAET
ncbi:MAG TPA: ATP-binding protein [Chryseosolibacter sp.]|nr:ATP-binding protein [Chryseosolibacter sp.]